MKSCGISPWKVKLQDDEFPNTYIPLQPKKSCHQQLNKTTSRDIAVKSQKVSREKSRRNSVTERIIHMKKDTTIHFNSLRPSILSAERKKKENLKQQKSQQLQMKSFKFDLGGPDEKKNNHVQLLQKYHKIKK